MVFDFESSLEAVQAALGQEDYSNAIALLEAICHESESQQARTQMRQLSPTHQDEVNRAIALCQLLSHSSNSQVQEWAARLQAELALHPKQSVGDLTGFVPFESQESEFRIPNSEFRIPNSEFRKRGQERTSHATAKSPLPKRHCLFFVTH